MDVTCWLCGVHCEFQESKMAYVVHGLTPDPDVNHEIILRVIIFILLLISLSS